MAKDPERAARRAEAAAKLGITEDELLARRKAADEGALAAMAAEHGVWGERCREDRESRRNRANRRTR
jgi:hypothetical protein